MKKKDEKNQKEYFKESFPEKESLMNYLNLRLAIDFLFNEKTTCRQEMLLLYCMEIHPVEKH